MKPSSLCIITQILSNDLKNRLHTPHHAAPEQSGAAFSRFYRTSSLR
jgi:hypothetical protein